MGLDGDARAAVLACPIVSWASEAWRFHNRRYGATDPGGSLKITGRHTKGRDRHGSDEAWPVLYLALGPHLALAERLRHTEPDALPRLNRQRLSRLQVELSAVLDCCDDRACRSPVVPHALATPACRLGVEGMLMPSCSRLGGGNLVVFPDRLHEGSLVELIAGEDPELFVDRTEGGPA